MDEEVNGKLEKWFRHDLEGDQFYLIGEIYGDNLGRFSDGTLIYTNTCEPQELKRGHILITKTSKYLLGKKRCERGWRR